MEELQRKNKVNVLNSKLDFIQPFKTHLQVLRGNMNLAPDTNKKRKADKEIELEDNIHMTMKRRRLHDLGNETMKNFSTNVNRASTPALEELKPSMKRKRLNDE